MTTPRERSLSLLRLADAIEADGEHLTKRVHLELGGQGARNRVP